MHLETFTVAVIAGVVALLVQLVSLFLARKSGLTEEQRAYTTAMSSMNRAMHDRVGALEVDHESQLKQIEELEAKVHDLERQIRDLMAENLELRRQLAARPPRSPARRPST